MCAIDLHTAAITRKSWWTPAKFVHDEASDDDGESTEHLLQCLDSAVQLRLRSDRPAGVFLSGGLDSRLIAALAARHDPTVRAFTLQLPGPFDESAQAAAIASRLGIPHHCVKVTETEILDTATRLHEICDSPFADSSLLATTMLAQRSREEIVVALGGDGGDELFGGYRRHAAAMRGHGPVSMFAAALGRLPQAFSGRIPIGRLSLAEALHRTSLFDHKGADYLGLRATQGNAEWLLAPPAGMQAATDWQRKFENSSPPWDGTPLEYLSAREMMLADLRTYLPDDPLVKIDRSTMSVALEARSPMLDHEVIETALNMPTSQLFDSRGGRAPIRSMLRSLDMPDTSGKRGFAVPLFRWLRGPLRDWASSLLLESDEDPLDQTAVAGIWQQLLNGRRDRAATIWTVLCWRSWLRGQSSR
jgi:asparagine synthase (glutamine-hydrolysing)